VFVVILVALLLFGVVVVVVVVVCGVGVVSPRTRQPISHSRPSKCRAGECSSSGTKTIKPYKDRVNLLFCSRLGSTQHNSMFGDLVLQQPRFPDAGRASPNHKEIHALQSFGDLVLQ